MQFSKIEKILGKKKGSFSTRGWIKRKRELKNKIFLLLRDETGELQCVLDREKADKNLLKEIEKSTIESSIELKGSAFKDERAPGGVELKITGLRIVGLAEDFPIRRDLSEEFLLDVRHLWVRSARIHNALRVRETVFQGFHGFMQKNDFVEVHPPMFVSGSVEGGATLFKVPYFGKNVYLTQSSQFYLEVLMFSIGSVYTIAPSFRAEKSRTARHLTEFWHAEAEVPWLNLNEMIDIEEKMIQHMVQKVLEKNKKELTALGRDPKTLEASAFEKYKRIKYEKAVKEIQKKLPYVKSGTDFGEKEEREYTHNMKKPVIITHYPANLKPFYHRPDPKNPRYILCNDILAPEGYGEILGGGERCWKKEILLERLKKDGLDPKPYQWYIDLRRFGSVPHSGFGLGLDRMTAWLCKAKTIKEAIPFPRTITRTYP